MTPRLNKGARCLASGLLWRLNSWIHKIAPFGLPSVSLQPNGPWWQRSLIAMARRWFSSNHFLTGVVPNEEVVLDCVRCLGEFDGWAV